ncbi:hypothetical protein [Rhizobium leguminosarum]|jgi:hypothetical protein|uniref:hypothetical protein n=1 Tax=Rhizobium leguminosarum TaxID=384 RepID=UPI001C91459C|nr:hypothetical protein [Rhizobium leguminosarum]MBY2932536.1 hypothetical protein [Rhizobium leguminosarum]
MADKSVVHIGENSPEQVAFKLFELVAIVEKKSTSGTDANEMKAGWTKADKNYILTTYGECVTTVRAGWYEAK